MSLGQSAGTGNGAIIATICWDGMSSYAYTATSNGAMKLTSYWYFNYQESTTGGGYLGHNSVDVKVFIQLYDVTSGTWFPFSASAVSYDQDQGSSKTYDMHHTISAWYNLQANHVYEPRTWVSVWCQSNGMSGPATVYMQNSMGYGSELLYIAMTST
jgi:hypothetical protein